MIEICNDCGNEKGVKHNTPFKCLSCGGIKFPLRPLRDIVFIYPDVIPEKIGSIYVPELVRTGKISEYGTVLAIGKGYHDKKGKYHPTSLKAGDRVVFDNTTPWNHSVESSDGKMHEVRYMVEVDVKGTITEGEEEVNG